MGVSCFAERVVVSEKSVVKVPDGVRRADRGDHGLRGHHRRRRRPQRRRASAPGRALLIIGAGGVGLSAVMGARLAGADPIIVADVDAAKLELAASLGATTVVLAGRDDTVEAVLGDLARRRGLGDRGGRSRGDAATGRRVPAARRHGGGTRDRARAARRSRFPSTSSCSGRSG